MALWKPKQRNPETVTFRRSGAPGAVILLHGFGGHASETWGQFPRLLADDPRLACWDIFGLGYPSSLRVDVPGVWTADPGISVLAQELQTALQLAPLARYRCIALVAHSMGGLVAQQALLEPSTAKRVTHVFLFGTPSYGLRKAALGSLLKPQLRDMRTGSIFLQDLRGEWKRRLGAHPPFDLRVVAGDRDEFVPIESSLGPFPSAAQAVIPGDHLSIVKPISAEHRGLQIVNEGLRGRGKARGLVDGARIAVEQKDFHRAIELLLPRQWELDEAALVQLALALDGLDRGVEALDLLERRYAGGRATTTDVMGVLAGRLKRRWLVERVEADLMRARELYSNALDRAEAANDADQAMYHAINIAFLDVMASPQASAVPESSRTFANRALDHSTRAKAGHWRQATAGEANLILGQLEGAVVAYRGALSFGPSAREIDSMYAQAVRAAGRTFGQPGVEAIEDAFGLASRS